MGGKPQWRQRFRVGPVRFGKRSHCANSRAQSARFYPFCAKSAFAHEARQNSGFATPSARFFRSPRLCQTDYLPTRPHRRRPRPGGGVTLADPVRPGWTSTIRSLSSATGMNHLALQLRRRVEQQERLWPRAAGAGPHSEGQVRQSGLVTLSVMNSRRRSCIARPFQISSRLWVFTLPRTSFLS